MVYCGCSTKANRIKWWVFGLMFGVGLIMMIVCLAELAKKAVSLSGHFQEDISNSKPNYLSCLADARDQGTITDEQYRSYAADYDAIIDPLHHDTSPDHQAEIYPECAKAIEIKTPDGIKATLAFLYLGMILLILSFIPCCMMCCCTKDPADIPNVKMVSMAEMESLAVTPSANGRPLAADSQ